MAKQSKNKLLGPHSEAEAWLWLIVLSPGTWLLIAIVAITVAMWVLL